MSMDAVEGAAGGMQVPGRAACALRGRDGRCLESGLAGAARGAAGPVDERLRVVAEAARRPAQPARSARGFVGGVVQARQRHAAETVRGERERLRAVGDLVERSVFGAELAHRGLDLVGGITGVGAGLPQGFQGLAGITGHRRHRGQCGVEPLLHGGIEPLHERVGAAGGLAEVLQRQGKAFLVLVAQQVVDAIGGLLHLREDGRPLLRQLAEGGALEGQPRQAARSAGQRRLRTVAVIEQHVGQARDALVAQHGEGGRGDGRLVVDGDADEHVARHVGIEADARDLAHGHALVAHGGLGLQTADALARGELVELVAGPVAGEPQAERRQQRRHHDHENARGQGVGLVFHQASCPGAAAGGADGAGAIARRPRSPRKKC